MPFVSDPDQLYNAWAMSKSMGCRPSEVFALEGLEAYAFDSAVIRWGRSFDSAVDEAVNDSKGGADAEKAAQRVIRRWIPSSKKYANPSQR